jgi:glutamyl-tRNA synthetase
MDKLKWLNSEYLREMSPDRFREMAVHALARAGIDTNRWPLDYVKAALDTCFGKVKTFAELPAYAGFYFANEVTLDPALATREFTPESGLRLQELRDTFAQLSAFTALHLEAALKNLAGKLGIKVGLLVHPARLACTGNTAGPSLYHLMEVLGREPVLARLDQAIALSRSGK